MDSVNGTAQPQGWDANGNPIGGAAPTPPAQPQGWDANGNSVTGAQSGDIPGYKKISGPQTNPFDSLTQQLPGKQEGLYRFMDTSTAPQGDVSKDEFQKWYQHAPVVYVPYSKAIGLLGNPQVYGGLSSNDRYGEADRLQQRIQQQMDTAFNPMPAVGEDPTARLVLHPDEANRLLHDYTNDPNLRGTRVGNFFRAQMPTQTGIGFTRETAKTATFGGKIGPQSVRQFATNPQQNMFQSFGGGVEGMTEYASGEELLGAMTRVLGHAPTLVEAAKIEAEIQKGTPMGKLVLQSLKSGTVGTVQGTLKSGDVKTGLETGAATAATTLGTGIVANALNKGEEAARVAAAGRNRKVGDTSLYPIQEKPGRAAAEALRVQGPTEEQITDAEQARQAAIDANRQRNELYREAATQHKERVKATNTAYGQQVKQAQVEHKRNVVAPARAAHEQEVAAGEAAHAQNAEAAQAAEEARAAQAEEATRAEAAGTYGKTAGQAIEPHLRAVEETAPKGPLGVSTIGLPVRRPLVNWNTDEVLSRVGDYTGARAELQKALNESMDTIDKETGGRFRSLNQEVATAQKRAYETGAAADHGAYKQKLNALDDVISSSKNVTPEHLAAVRSAWRQYYLMGDFTNAIDNKVVMGVPGETGLSQTQRGINGKAGIDTLRKLVTDNDRTTVANVLGGEERLKALEQVFEKTSTNSGRKQVNQAVVNVAKYVHPQPFVEPAFVPPARPTMPEAPRPPKRVPVPSVPKRAPAPAKEPQTLSKVLKTAAISGAGFAGYGAGMAATGSHLAGGMAAGLSTGVATAATIAAPATVRGVQNMMLANPRFAKLLIYAAETGADPKIYGPMLAKHYRQANQENQSQEETNGTH